MVIATSADLVEQLQRGPLLTDEQRTEAARLQQRYPNPKAFAKQLLERGWLTSYQVNQLFLGKRTDLVFGPYVVLERLGEGGAGQVFKARHANLNRTVALKVVRKELLADQDALNRFQREIKVISRLSHPHVVSAHDAGSTGGSYYLAMEYINGIDLAELVDQKGPLPVDQAIEYTYQAAQGLQHIKERGLVHRDIKPSNVLVAGLNGSQASRWGGVKILDLGLARLQQPIDRKATGNITTASTVVMGSLDYMAPEQAVDFRRVDIRADIYSLGCTLYYLLTGKPPFGEGTVAQILLHHQQTDPKPVHKIRRDVTRQASAVLRKMMAKEPEDRYQAPAELVQALEAIRGNGMPVTTLKGKLPSELGRQSLRNTIYYPQKALAFSLNRIRRRPRWFLYGAAGIMLLFLVGWFVLRDSSSSSGTTTTLPPGSSPLAHLDAGSIPAAERPKDQPPELVAVMGESKGRHWGMARCVAFNPVARQVASAGMDNVIRLWNAATMAPQAVLTGHNSLIYALAYSPDGKILASASQDRTVRLWDLTGSVPKQRNVLTGHAGLVHTVAFSPDGKTLASSGDDKIIIFWNVATGGRINRLAGHQAGVTSVAFSPNGRFLASGSLDRTTRLYTLAGNRVVQTLVLTGHKGRIWTVAFSPDSKTLATGSEDQRIILLDITAKPRLKAMLVGHTKPVLSVAFAPDGKTLASGSDDKTIRLWDVAATKPSQRARLAGHSAGVSCVAFNRSGRLLASGSGDATVRLWNLGNQRARFRYLGHTGSLLSVGFADGQTVFSSGIDGTVRWWNLGGKTPEESHVLKAHRGEVWSTALSPNGSTLATAGSDHLIRLWNARTRQPQTTLKGHTDTVYKFVFAPDGKTAASCSADRTVKLWDVGAGKQTATLSGHTMPVRAVAYSPDGKLAASGGLDPTIRLWDVAGAREKTTLVGHSNSVLAIAFSPDGQVLASGGKDHSVRLWDVSADTPTEKPMLKGHTNSVLDLKYTADGRILASAGFDGRVILWDHAQAKPLKQWQFPGPVYSIAFAPDGWHLVTGNSNSTLYVLRLPPELVSTSK